MKKYTDLFNPLKNIFLVFCQSAGRHPKEVSICIYAKTYLDIKLYERPSSGGNNMTSTTAVNGTNPLKICVVGAAFVLNKGSQKLRLPPDTELTQEFGFSTDWTCHISP